MSAGSTRVGVREKWNLELTLNHAGRRVWETAPMAEIELEGFEHVSPLGSGGLGDVYRATRTSTQGDVAIKILRDWSDHDVAWQRAQRELRALVDLRGHPNVVNVEEEIEEGRFCPIGF